MNVASTDTIMEMLKAPFHPGFDMCSPRIQNTALYQVPDYDLWLLHGSGFLLNRVITGNPNFLVIAAVVANSKACVTRDVCHVETCLCSLGNSYFEAIK
jgi:hypothetical protein